ncbi:MAG: hypothetical protein Q9222_002735 [Ikaeria aurantiellina]
MNHAKEEMVRMKEAGRPWKEICAKWLETTGKVIQPKTANKLRWSIIKRQDHLTKFSEAKEEIIRMKEAGRSNTEVSTMWLEKTGERILPSSVRKK